MSGEGATSGLIGELPPLPLSVLHSPSDIRSDLSFARPGPLCFFFQHVPSTPLGSARRVDPADGMTARGGRIRMYGSNKTHREAGGKVDRHTHTLAHIQLFVLVRTYQRTAETFLEARTLSPYPSTRR